ncbi:enoyl-CoA hydratase/isomerase family protein [Variovorax sp. YR216]|uniref:enoyl-CoA hydratase/isomerase family protein n=1 Tax=Variovorax sp. YR216 TaxID=1882828 RepID=UPI000B81CC1C|nr:enoyl-CoA hydratase/isomerase family protein [Variovorax sp. YR216]
MTSLESIVPSEPQLSLRDGVATITFNRPVHRNRLEDADLRALLRHFERVDTDASIRVVKLTANTQGQPRPVFCAGYHIGGFDSEAGLDASIPFERVADALAALRPVTVCALNGSVYGGATDLVLACDLCVGLSGIEFRMPATALGLHYYPSGLQRYVARMGISGAKRAFLTARPFTAEMLLRMGCLEEVAEVQAFDGAVARLVDEISNLAPLALQSTKRSLDEIAIGRMDVEAIRQREALTAGSLDFAEGRAAFQEKRKPRFTGS